MYDRHAVLIYHDQNLRWDHVAAFTRRGLERGEMVLCTAPSEQCPFEDGLASRGVDVATATKAGQLARLPMDDLFSAGGMPGYISSVLARGFSGVRLCGSAVGTTAHLGAEGMRAAEQEMDRLCETLPVAALCQYDAHADAGDHVAALVAAHPQAVRCDGLVLTRQGGRVRVAGELDLACAPALQAALEQAALASGDAGVLVDLSELSFTDITGHDALLRGTEAVRARGRVVVVRGATGSVERVLRMLGMPQRDDVLFV